MPWDSNNSNTWSTASLNTYLNGTYLTSLGDYSNKIATTTWKVGGNTYSNIVSAVPKTANANEITNPAESTTYSAKIGLMYVSDYGFAASPSAWTTTLDKYKENDSSGTSITTINWMNTDFIEWTISRDSDYSYYVFSVFSGITGDSKASYFGSVVKPVFYLASSVLYSSGSGTSSDHIRIVV